MRALGHNATAVSVALGIPQVLGALDVAHIGPEQALAAAVLAVPFSAGPLSPDADQTWLRAFGHRRGVHGWWWPALAGWALVTFAPALAVIYAAWGPIIGWSSHLLPADTIFGKGGRSIPKGIPLIPFAGRRKWNRFGLGIRVTGRDGDGHSVAEMTVTWGLILFVIPWQAWTLIAAIPR